MGGRRRLGYRAIVATFVLMLLSGASARAARNSPIWQNSHGKGKSAPTPTPTPISPTPSPTATPTPSNVGNEITITVPTNGQAVSGTAVTVNVTLGPDVYWDQLLVDGVSVASGSGNFTWDSTTVANGQHTLTVSVFQKGGTSPIGSAWVAVQVNNPTASPTATATPISTPAATPSPTPTPAPTPMPTPTPAPTPMPTPTPDPPNPAPSATPTPTLSNVGNEITITSPANGQTVSGTAVAVDVVLGPDVYWDQLMVDGTSVASGSGNLVWDSTTVPDGQHTLMVRVFQSGGTVPIGTAYVVVNVSNAPAVATPTPSATPTPLSHLSNLPPGASLPSDSTCATLANEANFPETTNQNVNDGTGWDANDQIWTTPSYFYANAGDRGNFEPSADFTRVDGNYSGTTQDIIRWAACKWGVDEDWAYAESAEETGQWTNACAELHGGTTCDEGGDCGNPDSNGGGESADLSFLGIPVTNSSSQFIGTDGIGGTNGDGMTCSSNWASYGILQNKMDAGEWFAWPMAAVSTAWNEDYRWAKWRSCVNGDLVWFQSNSDYTNAVSRATSNPNGLVPSGQAGPTNLFTNETNMQYLGLGCVAAHFSGGWYTSASDSYLTNSTTGFMYHLNNKAWLGGRG